MTPIPRYFIYIACVLIVLLMIPPALIARARTTNSSAQRIHLIQDMDNQARFRTQQANDLFRDGRAMRPPVEGTVARGELRENAHLYLGVVNDEWAANLPDELTLDRRTLERGRERYNIYCGVCHGEAGYGDGIVHKRAMELMNNPAIANGTSWVQPKNIHEPAIRAQPVGQIYNTITNGIRNMAGYKAQIPVDDRWAIAAYVKALQRSQDARPEDVGGDVSNLPVVNLVPPAEPAPDQSADENAQENAS